MLKKIRIRKHETGLLFRDGDFRKLMRPGVHRHWGWTPFFHDTVLVVDRLETLFTHTLLDALVLEPALKPELTIVDLANHQRALVWKDGRLGWILGPGRYAFWQAPAKVEVEVFDVNDFVFKHDKLLAVFNHPGSSRFFDGVRVDAQERVLLFRDGRHVDTLDAGLHVFWKDTGRITWQSVDTREQTLDVAGQEIMTADKVTLRVNLMVAYRVEDVVLNASAVEDADQSLYRESQLALRAAIGARPLDQLLGDKESIGEEVRVAIADKASRFGVAIKSVGLRDIILPGDMKSLLNRVIEAQKQAEANLIQRREETAAARSQANTAKLLAESPQLARMKELEALQGILEGAKTTFVFGSGDIVNQVRGLTAADRNPSPSGADKA
ncbi:MAG: slipin family protein [Planctomycetota bacterium]|jgi:regulator of protease activity HflC (stomatin/prohibitin superfamily)